MLTLVRFCPPWQQVFAQANFSRPQKFQINIWLRSIISYERRVIKRASRSLVVEETASRGRQGCRSSEALLEHLGSREGYKAT